MMDYINESGLDFLATFLSGSWLLLSLIHVERDYKDHYGEGE